VDEPIPALEYLAAGIDLVERVQEMSHHKVEWHYYYYYPPVAPHPTMISLAFSHRLLSMTKRTHTHT
jgi:hypothetical protein